MVREKNGYYFYVNFNTFFKARFHARLELEFELLYKCSSSISILIIKMQYQRVCNRALTAKTSSFRYYVKFYTASSLFDPQKIIVLKFVSNIRYRVTKIRNPRVNGPARSCQIFLNCIRPWSGTEGEAGKKMDKAKIKKRLCMMVGRTTFRVSSLLKIRI